MYHGLRALVWRFLIRSALAVVIVVWLLDIPKKPQHSSLQDGNRYDPYRYHWK
jgi:hypothetical protein